MRGSLVMASNPGSASQSTSKPVQIIKLVKPPAGQAETFHASFDGTVKIDFTAIANEKITLCHDNKNQSLHVIFADDSQVIIEPFFNSMAVMSNLVFEMTPGQVLNSAEFASQFPITTDQSVLPAGAEGVQSGAEFNDPSVDPLPPNVPLGLLPPEELPPIVFHETIPAPLPTEALALPTLPTLPPVPPPAAIETTGSEALVNEAGLPGIGSNAASNSEIFNGSITSSGGTGPYIYTLNSPATGSHGTLVLNADGTYTYTLTSPFDTTPDSATTAAQTEQDKDSFNYTVTDAHGNTATGTILVDIIDDVPTAHADTDATAVGQFTAETGNVITAVGTTSPVSGVDVLGADGAAVSGVAAGNTNADLDNAATLNTPIQGAFGKLTLAADGSYSYTRDAGTAGGADDVFTYTLKDGDGDLSHTTLTISVGDSTPSDVIPAPGGATTTVFEQGLPARGAEPAGSGEIADGNPTNNSDPSETVSGTIAFTSPDGVSVISLGGLVLTGAPQTLADGTTGTLTASFSYDATTDAGVISYSYTLIDNTLVDPSSSSSFAVVVTDADGDSAPAGNLVISIIDDVPTAHVDSGNVAEGALLTVAAASGVLVNDVAGADGFAAGGGVVGVRAAGSDLTSDVTTGVATPIAGLHGTLHLNADGSYTYQSTANNIAADATDVFVYTIKDGDGDLSTTTLTIDLTNVTLSATDTDALVNEAGLPVIGSNAASNSEIFNGSITPSGGTGPYTFALTSPATGSHGTLVLDAATGTYTYTLTTPFDTTPDSTTTAAQTEQDKDSFGYTVTDAQGNSTTGTILVDIIDDVPTAHVDSGNVAEGALLTVAAASGVLVNDVAGADGFAAGGGVVGVRAAGSDLTSDVTTGVATPIAGLHGTLHLNADGSYTYQSTANNIAADATDVFVYTIKDGDGDLSTTTLTIDLTNVTLSATDTDALVNEAGLPVIGSNAASNSEIFNGSITPSGGTGPYTFALTSPATGSHGTLVLDAATGTYTYTLTTPFDTTPDSTTTAAQTEQDKDSFGYTVTDAQGNSTTGTILVDIIDDVPTAHVDSGNVAEGALLTVAAASGVLVNDVAGADGFAAGGGVVGVRAAGSDLTSDVTTGVATPIAGLHGTLHLNADGSYTYQSTANNIAADATDVFVYTIKDGDGDLSTTTLTIDLTNVTLSATDTDALVNEAGLPVIGSNAASNSEIFNGSITPSGGTGPYTFALTSPATGSHGTLVLDAATGTYTYTLTTPFDTTPDSTTTAAQTEQDKDSFGYTVTDAQGNSTTGTILVDIIDDVPTAHVDSGNVAEGALLTVAAASGVLVNDVAGADGFAAGGGVVGVRAAGSDLTSDVTTGVATPIAGLHGTLHLNADGSYTYQSTANNIAADATDVFVYTIKDGDGDLSTTTLTIDLTNVTLSATDTDALVNEAGLPVIGSNAASNSEIFNGSITPSGGTGPYTFALTSPATGSHGTLVLDAATGTYTYTLTTPFDTTPDSTTTAAQTEQDKDSFGYTVTDAQGNSTTGTILVDIIDDVPTAHVDSGNVAEGALLTVAAASGVLVNDVAGADGFAAGGGVVGVRAAGSDLTSDVTTGVATPIAGLHGTLHLNADGSYTYQSTANNIAADATDVFVYTIKDGDGDLSTTTLTIDLTNVTLSATDTDALVNEAGLPVIGSNAASNSEIFNGSITPSGGTGPYTFALTSPATGSHGTLVLDAATGTYTYTLTTPFDTTPDSTTTAAQTEQDKDSFGYTVTDAQGNSTTGTILVDIIDDVPTAHVDSGNVAEGALLTVAAASGVLVNDVAGADGFAAGGGVVGVRAAGSDLTSDVTTGVATPIAGLHGTLHLNADGSYTYQSTANNIAADATDVFVYTIKDGDGDLSTTTLTIDLANATVLAPTDNDVTVNENALDTTITGSDLAAGTITGSLGTASPAETDASNQLNGSGGFGTLTYALVGGGNAATAGTFGTIQVHADGSYVYTLTKPFDTTPDANNGPNTEVAENFQYTVTDAVGNTATGTITVNIVDDVPSVTAVGSGVTLALDEGNTNSGAPPISTPATINTGAIVKGDDPDVAGTGSISQAVSAGALVTPTIAFGADGPFGGAPTTGTSYALSVNNPVSGLSVTDGSAITLQLVSGVVVGVVSGGTFNGQAAFAISINSGTGVVTVEQYLSLHQPITTNPNDPVTLALNSLAVTVTVTDGDGDKASAQTNVSAQISFADDGPRVVLSGTPVTLTVDETVLATNATASFATAFTAAFGADGPLDANHDGVADANALTFALGISASGAASGLVDTLSGNPVFLFLEGGHVVGREGTTAGTAVGGPIVFDLSVSGSNVTLDQQRAVVHPNAANPDDSTSLSAANLVTLTATVTDGDGDTSQATLNIGQSLTFKDDGPTAPTVTVSAATAGVDETPGVQTTGGASDVLGSTAITFNGGAITVAGLFGTVANKGADTDVLGASLDNGALSFASSGASSMVSVTGGAFGADGPAASTATAYRLAVTNAASGLTLTDGTAITLSLDGSGRVIGTVGVDAANPVLTGQAAFAIAIDPLTGQVYVAEYLSLHQGSASNPNDLVSLAAGSVGVTVTLTDGDGDRITSAAANIGTHINFLDDGPSNISPLAVSLLNGSGSATASLDIVDTNTDNNYGADGGSVVFAASLNGQDSGLTSSAQKIFYQTSNGGHTLTGFADKNLNGVYDPATDTTAIFTINLNLDKSLAVATDTYTVQMLGRVDSATHIDFNSGGYNFVGGNDSWAEFIPVGETVANPIDNNSPDLLLTPAVNHLPASSINTSANSGGVGSGQSVGSVGNLPETFRVDFVTDLRGDPAGSPANYGNPANRDHVFDGHYTVDGSSTDFTATSGSTINIAAFDDPDGNNIVGDGVKDKITGVVIRFGGSTSGFIDLTQLTNPSLAVGGHNFTITENADGSIDVGGVAGTTSIATFTANGYNSLEYTWVSGETFKIGNFGAAKLSTAPVDFSVPVQVVDGDGDTAAGSIGVTLTQPPAPTVTITDDEAGTANIASGSILYTFQFSETVTGFDAADITVVNGTPGTFTAVDGDTYTLVVTPMADFQGILTVGVAAGVAFDAAAAPNTAAALSVQAVDTLAPVASITLDAITADNIVNAAEAAGPVAVTGTVGGDVQVGDTVTLMVNGNSSYTGQVQAGLTFSIDVAGSDLAAGTNVHASVNTTDAAGNAATATDDQAYTVDTANPSASVDIAANLLTQTNIESLVTIHFNEAVTGFGPDDLTVVGGATPELLTFQQIDADTYTMKLLVEPNFEGTAQVTLDGAYTDLAGNPGITGASDTVDINTLASTLDATILTTGTSGLGQTVALTFVDLQNPIFSYAGLYDLGAQGGAFQRDAGFNIDPSKEYAVSLEATGEVPVPIRVLTVEGVTIHVIEGTVTLQLDNDNSTILDSNGADQHHCPTAERFFSPRPHRSTETLWTTTVCLTPKFSQVLE